MLGMNGKKLLYVGLSLGLLSGLLWVDATRAEATPFTRGAALAAEHGCISCHARPELGGVAVPPLAGCDLSEDEFRTWVLHGSAGNARRGTQQESFGMPAYAGELSDEDIEDLRAWAAIQGHESEEARASGNPIARGEALAYAHGCFDCHGPLGQGGTANPRSLTGAIPGFSGSDFSHLCADNDIHAIEEWIRHGRSERFLSGDPFAFIGRAFIRRQLTKMPAYESLLSADEVTLLAQYCLHINALGPMNTEAYAIHKLSLADGEGLSESHEGRRGALPAPIATLFSDRCVRCHGPKKQKSGYRMDTAEAAFTQGEIASFLEVNTITPGAPDESLLVRMISATEEDPENEIFPMPPSEKERLSEEEIQWIRDWIAEGADWSPEFTLESTTTD